MTQKNPLVLVLVLSTLFFVIFLAVAVTVVMSLTPGESKQRIFSRNNIGVLEVKGVILDSKKFVDQLESLVENKTIKGIVIRVNSPGGAVAPSQEMYSAVRRSSAKKPIYVSMGSVAASGGFYLAVGAKKIFANPGTITGSIGVIMQFMDMSRLFDWAKVSPYSIKTGKFKDIGSPNRQMTNDEKDLLQAMMENVLMQFRKAVAQGRSLSMEKVIEVSDGRILSGEQAKDLKLVDELGGFSESVEALAKEVGIDGKPVLVYPTKRIRAFERLFADGDDDAESSSGWIGRTVRVLSQATRLLGVVSGHGEPFGAPEADATGLMGPVLLAPLIRGM